MGLTCYTNELIWLAQKFDESLSIERNDTTHKYIVFIKNTSPQFKGLGFTVEDACCDFFRLARGEKATSSKNKMEIEIV